MIKNNKILGLEIIRFISAVAILFWHYKHFSFNAEKIVAENQPFYDLFKYFYDYGFLGVQVFWCISGYIFFWRYGSLIEEKITNAKTFFVLRFSRLYPLHFATLLLTLVLQVLYFRGHDLFFVYQDNDLKHFLAQLFLASDWGLIKGNYSFNGPVWSISVEVLIYFIFFVTTRLFGTSAAINIWVMTIVALIMGFVPELPFNPSILVCLGFFYGGGLAALAVPWIEQSRFGRQIQYVAWGVIFLTLASPYWIKIRLFENQYFFLVLIYVSLIIFCFRSPFNVGERAGRCIEVLGNMTYASYLIHFPLQLLIVVVAYYLRQEIPIYSPYFFISFIGITLCLSFFVFRYFEVPMQKFLRTKYRA